MPKVAVTSGLFVNGALRAVSCSLLPSPSLAKKEMLKDVAFQRKRNNNKKPSPSQQTMSIQADAAETVLQEEERPRNGQALSIGASNSRHSKKDDSGERCGNSSDSGFGGDELPTVLYDPESGNLMMDPVVVSSGDSCERDTAEYIYGTECYSNRALKSILLDYAQLGDTSTTIQATMGWDESIACASVENKDVLSSIRSWVRPQRKLHESLYCPITCDLMKDPVITPDGNTYERSAIEEWVQTHGTSPVTRNALTSSQLFPNNAIAAITKRAAGNPTPGGLEPGEGHRETKQHSQHQTALRRNPSRARCPLWLQLRRWSVTERRDALRILAAAALPIMVLVAIIFVA